ncbi:3-deoxy-D-manno-octulosonate 8-phosphate phosphatase [Candidatus Methylomirabilis lanthanidiphila]|uniref:3-deoxy-D-manno-octulosonate 8-phosphate phosphatase n=1 Tax=Candidatus Methylomirabilis lanthanidiphila TaxID=2211376 RepID=A0A564ZK59_9BACT|nr:HAD hydrolase family protein [Candidatus Methylomirabilis lanthanidiphila]VUZ84928.1 3-deoxy-D-manno-octulosonate 8-phosphate phosphatase [Candidatus Methylomirabilis lanthanidiphila]
MSIDPRLQEKAKAIRLLITDVDGVLTDGRIFYSADGVESEAFFVRDGLGLRMARQAGLLTAILTGRVSGAVAHRAKELGITEIHHGVLDKLHVYEMLLQRYGLTDETAAYIGDDLNDLPVLRRAGFSAAPADADPQVRTTVAFVTTQGGGRGAVREVIDLILKAQGRLEPFVEGRWPGSEEERPGGGFFLTSNRGMLQ